MMAWKDKKEAKFGQNIDSVELLNGQMPLERIHWCVTQRQGNTMIIIFWDVNFLCDYLSPKGLFYNSVTYQILLNKILLILTKKDSQWKKHELSDIETSQCTVILLCLCCLLYLHCLSCLIQTSGKYTLML